MRSPRRFLAPLALGAPSPLAELPIRLERMIHFVPPHLARMRDKAVALAGRVDVILANLEDAIPADLKSEAREGAVALAGAVDWAAAGTGFWVRINALDSPFVLDDLTTLLGEAGGRIDVLMAPKIEGPADIHFLDRMLALLEARAGLSRPLLVHPILETAEGVANVEAIACASPRIHGLSLGPADLAASRAMKTTRVGGGHPGYRVIADPAPEGAGAAPRASAQQDPWHYTLARMVDACALAGVKPFYGPFGDFSDPEACEVQFGNAYVLGCVGAWTLHPSQIEIAARVFTPAPDEIAMARRILEALPDGSGAAMVDGKMQDDATVKQAKVIVALAEEVETRARRHRTA